MRHLPVLLDRADWARARGLLQFGLRRTAVASLVAAVSGLLGAITFVGAASDLGRALVVACLALPVGALAHFAMEALSAAGRPVHALIAFKLLTPAVALVLSALGPGLFGVGLTAPAAVGCWTLAWTATLGVLSAGLLRALPEGVRAVAPVGERAWASEARPFFVYRLSFACLMQTPLLALELLGAPAAAVGAYAAASGAAGVAVTLASSTNRSYAQQLAILLERRDYRGVMRARLARLVWLAPMLAVFLVATLVFPREILALHRPEFAAEGGATLRILALAAAFTVVFAMAPTFLKFRQRNRAVYTGMAGAALLQPLLIAWLTPPFGSTGAAVAHATCLIGLYGLFARLSYGEAKRRAAAAGNGG